MKDKLYKIIYDWVFDNFGMEEANDPSWNIDELAREISKHSYELYSQQELEYLTEDVERYADDNNYKLTDKQIRHVAKEIMDSEWYCSIDTYMLGEYIKEELKKGEQ